MKVKDLIEQLQKFDPDMRVVVNGRVEDGVCDCGLPIEATISPDTLQMDWQGPHYLHGDYTSINIKEKWPKEQAVYINSGE